MAIREDLKGDFKFLNPIFHSDEAITNFDFNIEKEKLKTPPSINEMLKEINFND